MARRTQAEEEYELEHGPDLTPPDRRFWIEGKAWVPGLDEETLKRIDFLRPLLREVGFELMEQVAGEDSDKPERRRWSLRRVPSQYVVGLLWSYHPVGLSIFQLSELLYREEPWTHTLQKAALLKTRVMINYLHDRGQCTKRHVNGELRVCAAGARFLNNQPRPMVWADLEEPKTAIKQAWEEAGWKVPTVD